MARAYEQEETKGGETREDRKFITDLFARLNVICTAGFHNLKSLSPEEAKAQIRLGMREWLDEFKLAKMNSPELVEYAVGRIRSSGSPFIPTVGEFLQYCEEGRLPVGTKNAKESYEEWFDYDCKPKEKREPSTLSQPTYHTMSVIFGSGRKGHLTGSKPADAEKCWTKIYDQTLERLKDGKPLKVAPEPAIKLEKLRTPSKKSTAANAIAEMKKGLGL